MSDFTPAPAAIILADHSAMVGTSSVQVLTAGQLPLGTRYLRIVNPGTTGWIWISRSGPAAVNAIGSYPLPPGSQDVWDGNFIPVNPLWAIAVQPNTLLIVEAGAG